MMEKRRRQQRLKLQRAKKGDANFSLVNARRRNFIGEVEIENNIMLKNDEELRTWLERLFELEEIWL